MLRESEFARRTEAGIEIRPGPLRLKWELTELTTSDGHLARGAFITSVRALPDANELKMLDEALLGSRPVATMSDVIAYFADAILSAARKQALIAEAQALLGDKGRQAMATLLMEAAGAVAFACGIEILQPAQVDLDCPTLQRQRFEEMDRQAAQRRAAEQVDQLRRSAELLKQFEAIRASAPELSPSQILNRVSSTDQADVFRAMALASSQKSAPSRLLAVAGNSLIQINGETFTSELRAVSGSLGPLRSLRANGSGALLLGCQMGVLRAKADFSDPAIEYLDSEVQSRLGFNAAGTVGDKIWAAHGEAGLVCWNFDDPKKPAITVRPVNSRIPGFSPRNIVRLDADRFLFSSGGQLAVASNDGEVTTLGQPAGGDIIGIFVQSNRILTVQADGQVCSWGRDDLKLECGQRRAGRVCAAAALPWLGDVRLLLATEDGPIVCIGPDDELLTQFTSAYPGQRIVAAAGDAVAAVTGDRQRLVLWHPWEGRKPIADIFVYGQAKHRVADIAFV